jgi:uncharacterized SAM-binding protein YcdF (DUF218 family)
MKMKSKNKWTTLIVFSLLVAIIASKQTLFFDFINENLQSYLTSTDELSQEKVFDAVYILGGSQESLKAKFKAAASIYARGRCKNIIILNRPGITEYNNSLGRNLTNDEWSMLIFESLSVSPKDVRTLEMEPGFFGTFTEAKWVSQMAKKNGWKSLLLITSPHHTKRVKKSFDYFFKGTGVNFWVEASNHNDGFWELLSEFIKLQFYQVFLLF